MSEGSEQGISSRAQDRPTYGRVADDGTVYVTTAEGERMVGQVPDVPADEAMAFFTRRFQALEVEVSLLEQRVASSMVSPEDAATAAKTIGASLVDAHAVGDLVGLQGRLDALGPVLAEQRAARRAERARQSEETKIQKEKLVGEAEKLAESNDWRDGVNRFRSFLDEWKVLPRLDRASDDALWHRFSVARTTYTRRRKAQFAAQNEQRDVAKAKKEKLAAEAEALADSTDWGPTSAAYRELMTRWKAAGSAARPDDDALWKRFRGAQDTFFSARQTTMDVRDVEFRDNAEAKEKLLVEGEKLLPITDLGAAKQSYRELVDRWSAIGKVPRESVRALDGRLKAIESAIASAEDDRWRRNNPEARARAEDTAAKLVAQISSLEERAAKAEARGEQRAAQEARESAATYREWLTQAQRAAADFGG